MRNCLCSTFGNWKIKKLRRFVNSIAPLQEPARQSLHTLQRRGAFIAAFTSEKWWMTIKKSLFRNWQLIPIFSSRICQSLYDVKPKAQSERCAPHCVIGNWGNPNSADEGTFTVVLYMYMYFVTAGAPVAGVTGWKENNRTTCGLVVESADQMEHVGDWRSSLRFQGSPDVGKTSWKKY